MALDQAEEKQLFLLVRRGKVFRKNLINSIEEDQKDGPTFVLNHLKKKGKKEPVRLEDGFWSFSVVS